MRRDVFSLEDPSTLNAKNAGCQCSLREMAPSRDEATEVVENDQPRRMLLAGEHLGTHASL